MFKNFLITGFLMLFSFSAFSQIPQEGNYGTQANYCGYKLTVSAQNNKLYLETIHNPTTGKVCQEVGLVRVYNCQNSPSDLCINNQGGTLHLISNTKFIINSNIIFDFVHNNTVVVPFTFSCTYYGYNYPNLQTSCNVANSYAYNCAYNKCKEWGYNTCQFGGAKIIRTEDYGYGNNYCEVQVAVRGQ